MLFFRSCFSFLLCSIQLALGWYSWALSTGRLVIRVLFAKFPWSVKSIQLNVEGYGVCTGVPWGLVIDEGVIEVGVSGFPGTTAGGGLATFALGGLPGLRLG